MSNIYTGPGQGARVTQIALFKQIWIRSNKRSFVSGLHLREFQNTELFLSCFPHILAKGQNQYPRFKYYAGNVRLMTVGEHSLWDNGTIEARLKYEIEVPTADWKKVEALRDELIKLYKKHFPSTFGGILNEEQDGYNVGYRWK
ncbi:hypothetical protein LCGC14_1578660 [marine sediment metagenome]|uniref:Uncharacterized protein n=1 Tax=marine sediment metagenome TaxID=412755 RepID=A0A0F9J3N0_9ZZZZ